MKQIKFLAIPALVLLASSCLKDKNYLDGQYGTNLDQGQKTVSFARTPSQNFGAELTTTAATYKVVLVQASAATPTTEDVSVSVAFKPSLVTGTTYEPLPAGALVLPTGFKIAKGQYYDSLPLTFPNTSLLDLTKTYAVGLTITSAGAGYTTATNRADLLLIINLKNQYDADYDAVGYFYHPSAARTLSATKTLSTIGPNVVEATLGDLGGSNFRAFFTINNDNTLTIVAKPGAASAPYFMYTSGLPTTNPGYTPQWSGSAQCNNTYDPVTRTFKVRYGYLGGTGLRVTEEIFTRQ
jgi:Domain of unknown function (DUF1735)/Domain of unknown function (DUF4361)